MKPLHILTALALILAGFGASAVINVAVNPGSVIIDSYKPTFPDPSCSDGTQNSAHSCSFSVTNNVSQATYPLSCTLLSGSLPTGQSVSSDCSGITGTPTTAESVSATIRACAGVNCTDRAISYTINAAGVANIGTGSDCIGGPEDATHDYCQGSTLTTTVTARAENNGSNVNAVFNWTATNVTGGGQPYWGRFVNGDYWVAPSAGTQVQIDVTGSDTVYVDLNPTPQDQGFLSSYTYSYDATERVTLPATVSGGTSVVAAIKRDEAATSNCGTSYIVGDCIDAYQVITVLSSVPGGYGKNMFRTNVAGTTKYETLWSDLDLSSFPSYSGFTGTADAAERESIRQRWSHNIEFIGNLWNENLSAYAEHLRAFRAHILVDDYGAGNNQDFGQDIIKMMSDDNTVATDKTALAAMLTYGRDLYYAAADTGYYMVSGAGQHSGPFLAMLMYVTATSTTADDMIMQGWLDDMDTDGGNKGPQELAQLRGLTSDPVHGDYRLPEVSAYWADLFNAQCFDGAWGICNINTGKKSQYDIYGQIDGSPARPGTSYMGVSMGEKNTLLALTCLWSDTQSIVFSNDTRLAAYVDRVRSSGIKAAPDTCAPPDPRENGTGCDPYNNALNSPGSAASYQAATGCNYIGDTWGPDPSNPTGACIANNSGGNTGQTGRFPAVDGNALSPGYTISEIESNWTALRAMCP